MRRCLVLCLSASFLALPSALNAKTLRLAYAAGPRSLDPQERLSSGTLQLSHMVFDPLLRWRKDYSFEPRLAERWERLSGTITRFYLRRGVRFHSGAPFTARDVAWTFNRLKESPDFKALFAPLAQAHIIDEHTVDLVTSRPYPLVLNLATYIFAMDAAFYTGIDARGRDKGALVKNGASYASRHASGTGPFIIKERQEGVATLFERAPDYWDKRSPGNVTRIILTPIRRGKARVAALIAGDVDVIAPVPPSDLPRLRDDAKISLVTMTGTRLIALQLNQKRVAAFKAPRVRKAVVLAIDNAAIARKIMRGFATPAGQQSPPGYAGHDAKLTPRFDLRLARKLMQEAGFEAGFKVTMMAPNNRYVNGDKIARAVRAMLAKIKIKVALKTLPEAQYWPEFDARAADIMMIGWHSDTGDSANFSEALVMTPDAESGYGRYNSGQYANPTIDQMVLQSQTMTDAAARAKLLQRVEQMLYEDAAFVPLHWQTLSWAAREGVDLAPVVNVMNAPFLGDLVME